MMKDKILKNKEFIKEIIIIIVVGVIVNLACFFMCSITGHCATGGGFYPVESGYNWEDCTPLTAEQIINYCNNNIATIPSYSDLAYCIRANNLDNSSFPNACYFFILVWDRDNYPKNPFYITVSNDGYFIFNYDAQSQTDAFRVYTFTDWKGDFSDVNNKHYYTGSSLSSMNGNSPLISSLSSFSFVDNYYLGNINNEDFPVLLYNPGFNGGTTEFINAPLITGHALPTQPTAPTFTPPTYDSSLSLVENVKVFIQWLGQYIGNLFVWLLQNIFDYLDKLLQNLKAFINAVITAINNGFMNIYNNINSLFYPFITFFTAFAQVIEEFLENFSSDFIAFVKQQLSNLVSGISNLVDAVITIKNFLTGTQGFFETYGVIWNQQTWEDALDDSPWLDAVSDNTTTMSQFINGTLNVSEPQELTFTMDFRNAYYNFGLVTWDLSWYQPYKQPVRLAFLAICVLNALVYFFDEAPNFFSGGGSNKKGDK